MSEAMETMHELPSPEENDSASSPTVTANRPPPNFKPSEVSSPRGTQRPRLSTSAEYKQKMERSAQVPNSPRSSVSYTSNSGDGYDRVFPVRSVVSVDPTQTTAAKADSGEAYPFEASRPTHTDPKSGRRSSQGSLVSSRVTDRSNGDYVGRSATRRTTAHETRSSRSRSREIIKQHKPKDQETDSKPIPDEEGNEDHRYSRQYGVPFNIPGTGTSNSHKSYGSLSSTEDKIPASGDCGIKSIASDDMGGIVTARFKHVVTEDGHAVVTGRDGETLQRCEDEPIHIPGAIQGFGLLIAVSETEDERFPVCVVSENSKALIGYTPKQLFALDSFCDILSEEQTDNLLDHIDFIKDGEQDPATNGPEVFTISIRHPDTRRSHKLWAAIHVNKVNPDLIICEFELEDDKDNPLVPLNEGATPELPEDTLNSQPTSEEFVDSTVNVSKPLRVLKSARKKKGETAAMDVFNIMSQIEGQLSSAQNLNEFLKILIGVVKELTGFHRVMIYQFDHLYNGRVVSELVDPRATKDLYKGLNFPASDIPKQARELYKVNKVRLLYDRDQETARLVCRTVEYLETPLDLTYAYLRAMSPIHLKYLSHMAVRSSMSISINAFNELWGLIACHAYGPKGTRVSFAIRKMCRLIGDTASRNIERLSYASRLQARKLINTVPSARNPTGYIVASSEDLLSLFDADSGLLSIRDETKILGNLEATQEALALLEYFRLRKVDSVLTSQDITMDFPDLRYSPGFTSIAGLLLVPLSSAGLDFIIFFRKGQVREVKWAGNPYKKFIKQGTEGYLEPRTSFKSWSETVIGKCRDWTEEQVETGAVLCLVYGKFIEVWRQKEAALETSQLTKLLLANSAHEVRTPLNAIINYLEIAMEGSLDNETRENLSRSHSASKSLIYVINDLLDLTKTEAGNRVIKDDVFDFVDTVKEATDMFIGDAKRKGLAYKVIANPDVPRQVIGDQRRVRQAISNVTANAIQFTNDGSVQIELHLTSATKSRVEIDVVVEDTGVGMSPKILDNLFRELEQVQSASDDMLPDFLTSGEDPQPIAAAAGQGQAPKRTLGLGLAIVSRVIRHMNGQLRLRSEIGKGSRFVIQFGFEIPPSSEVAVPIQIGAKILSSASSMTPAGDNGEVLLVVKGSKKDEKNSRPSATRLGSTKSTASLRSFKSGSSGRSDVEKLIDAIQEPHNIRENPGKSTRDIKSGHDLSNQSTSTDTYQRQQRDSIGTANVQDQVTPIRPVRVPEEGEWGQESQNTSASQTDRHRVIFGTQAAPALPKPSTPAEHDSEAGGAPLTAQKLHTLVAEDDPINSKIMAKRLQKLGHQATLTVNGEDCASAYSEKQSGFDVVLMDMQMPIVDGLTSTKIIRSFEKTHSNANLSLRAFLNGRIPIFAVSATLIEKERQVYIDAGFDGWILKPVDFKRLQTLLDGIVDNDKRKACLYRPGNWEKGGWFRLPEETLPADTRPDPETGNASSSIPSKSSSTPTLGLKDSNEIFNDPFTDSISVEKKRPRTLDTDAIEAPSVPDDLGQSANIGASGP